MNLYEGEKYYCNINNVKDIINKYGVAIIPNLLNETECNIMINEMWNYLEYITNNTKYQITRNDKNSWKNYTKLYFKHSMLIQHWNIGHAQYIWNVRQNKKIINIFSKLYNVPNEQLLVSFDGASIHFPSEITNTGWNKKTKYHCDQSYMRNNFECIQSWINAYDTNIGDATLSFLEKSHLYHKDFKIDMNLSGNKNDGKEDWFILGENTNKYIKYYLNKGCVEKKIKCPRGSLVLWDSRTIHCGSEPLKDRLNPNFRCVVYLCYLPRILCNKANLNKKKKAFNELRTTNHNPCKIKLFSKDPRTYGGELPILNIIEKPILTDLGKTLAGF